MLRYSLLGEGIFAVAAEGHHEVRLTLPEVLARLSARHDLQFTGLRPHQDAPWHAFLVQLAYLALDATGDHVPPDTPAQWAACLRALTPGFDDDSPWCLVNTDWQAPAFMQPPCSEARVPDFKRSADAAQDIDVLVTSRHHDEKSGKLPLDAQHLDVLVYALILLQGWSAFLGAGNYNTMRMNGGFSSRPQFRLAFARGTGAEFRRDLDVLLETRAQLEERMVAGGGIGSSDGPLHDLLWLLPWDEGSLPLTDVHPLCLEVCRRIRLVEDARGLRLLRAGSNAMRVTAKEARGVVLDPWVPIVKAADGAKALTAQSQTLSYRSLQGLLFDSSKAELPTLAKPSDQERRRHAGEPATLIAHVLVSGDGGTDGLWVRELILPPPVHARFASADAQLGVRSRQFVELAATAAGKILRAALLQFVDGGEAVDWKNRDFAKAVEPWVARFEAAIDEAFFDQLFASFEGELNDAAAQGQWAHRLAAVARSHLASAEQALPTRDNTRAFASARAHRMLASGLRKHFGAWLDETAAPGLPTTEPAHA